RRQAHRQPAVAVRAENTELEAVRAEQGVHAVNYTASGQGLSSNRHASVIDRSSPPRINNTIWWP
ncbi:hypothetical protein, partial [Acidisphaera sp. S103]|uniref:hypothetical protein n=1 Tax=Acidisphaera sp. S103 TaxID=1747223 RepID=UPI001C201F73